MMKNIKWPFLLVALAAVLCMMGTGIAIGLRSPLGVIITLFAFIIAMGFGFKMKKKMRENGML